jgi:hypothetical protein
MGVEESYAPCRYELEFAVRRRFCAVARPSAGVKCEERGRGAAYAEDVLRSEQHFNIAVIQLEFPQLSREQAFQIANHEN